MPGEDQIMYISIDMDNLVFLHKHPDHETVSAISWLECGQQRSIVITATDKPRFLKTLTALELRMLYHNTTGGSISSEDTTELRYQLASAVELLPFARAVREEVLAQVAAVNDRLYNGEVFKYAFGASVPAQPQELFPLKGRPLKPAELDNASAWARSDLPAQTANAPTGPWPERREPEDAPEVPPAPPADHAEPEFGATTPLKKAKRANAQVDIFAAADKAWKDAGSPTDPTVVTPLIKGLIPELEERGFHPTTIRIKVSKWLKAHASQ